MDIVCFIGASPKGVVENNNDKTRKSAKRKRNVKSHGNHFFFANPQIYDFPKNNK